MRKVLLLPVLVMMLLGGSCIVRSSLIYFDSDTEGVPNLVINPSFSAYSLSPKEALKGWTVHTDPLSGEGVSIAIDTNQALQGETSLRVDASDKAVMIMSDAFRVRRYGGYYIRVSACSSQPAGPQLSIRFITFGDTGKIRNTFKTKLKTEADWTKATISAGFLKPGSNFGRVAIMIPPFSEGSVWIDDAGCWEVHSFRID